MALPNPWLYYLEAQLQHIAHAMPKEITSEGINEDPTTALLRYVTGMHSVAMEMEALVFAKSNKLFPTYIMNDAKNLEQS